MGTAVPLTNRANEVVDFALVDDADAARVLAWRWHLDKGYAVHSVYRNGQVSHIKMHRFVLGFGPDDPHVDHRDLNRLNNQRANLRPTTMAQNKQNGRNYKGSKSQYRGVSFRKDRGLWRATATVDGTRHYIGSSPDEDEAGRMAAAWRREHMQRSEMDA